MSNYNRTREKILNYICARTPLIIIESSERERVEQILFEIAHETAIEINYYTDEKQVIKLGKKGLPINTDSDPLLYISSLFKKNRGSIFAFGDVKRISDDNLYSRELLNMLYLARETDSTLILITPDTVWQRIMNFGMITRLDYPDQDERTNQINNFVSSYGGRFVIDWDSESIQKAATLLSGFTEIQIENILSSSLFRENGLSKEKIHDLTKQKSKLYTAIPSIQYVELKLQIEVSGLEQLKIWIKNKKHIFFTPDEILKQRDLSPPKGILLAGVPGCGKSYSAKMLAAEWELPLFRFDMGAVFNKYIGESERQMSEALKYIGNIAPCVLWIDEIEKLLSVSDSSNDTGKRVLGQFLFWLNESTDRVFVVATANDVSLLPPELLRKGRFSETFFIDLPNSEERKAAIIQYTKKSLFLNEEQLNMDELIDASEGFSYSDIEYAIKELTGAVIIDPQKTISSDDLIDKFKSVIPIQKSNPEIVENIRKWGRSRAVLASKDRRQSR